MLDLYESAAQSGGENSSVPKENNSSWEVHIDIKKEHSRSSGSRGRKLQCGGRYFSSESAVGDGSFPFRPCAAGEKIGADVPFCIMAAAGSQRRLEHQGRCFLCSRRGNRRNSYTAPVRFVLGGIGEAAGRISTAEVYRRIDEISIKKHPETAHLIEGISSGNMQKNKIIYG